METECEEPDLWVFECLKYTIPGKRFVLSSIAVVLESRSDVFLLLRSEEPGSRGVIVYEEVCQAGVEDSK